jgi:hypothetical protein
VLLREPPLGHLDHLGDPVDKRSMGVLIANLPLQRLEQGGNWDMRSGTRQVGQRCTLVFRGVGGGVLVGGLNFLAESGEPLQAYVRERGSHQVDTSVPHRRV